jgi:uncharacterized protein (TIGR00369 family)
MSDAADFWRGTMQERMGGTTFLAALGGRVENFDAGHGRLRLPFQSFLIGNPDTGVIHGGVLTTLLDQACGMAVGSALRAPAMIATLDLRIDYMKPAKPDIDLIVESECLKIAHEVAFTRGYAFQTTRDEPVAIATATFMLTHFRMPSRAEKP